MVTVPRTALADLGPALVRTAVAATCPPAARLPTGDGGRRLSGLAAAHGPHLLLELIAHTPSSGRYLPAPDPAGLSSVALALMIGAISESGLPEQRDVREQLVDALLEVHGWTLGEAAAAALAGTAEMIAADACAHAHLATARTSCRDYLTLL